MSEAEGLVMQAMATPEARAEFVRDVHHFRSVFAAAADKFSQFCTMQERSAAARSLDFQKHLSSA